MTQNARVALWVPTEAPPDVSGDGILTNSSPDAIDVIATRFAVGGGSGGVEEAPVDGIKYARKDADWVTISEFADAPTDGQRYARRNGVWALTMSFPEAPVDGNAYARKDADWYAIGSGGGIPDAPNDGKPYVRQSLGWVAFDLIDGGTF
jgi:hypothetical protein